MNKLIFKWALLFPISLIMAVIAIFLSPLLAMCVRKEYRLDTVKRFDKQIKGFDRYYLWRWLNWFQTHDNAIDEYFWGVYGDSDKVTINQYDNSILLRYWYRVAWLNRNPAYGFNHQILGIDADKTIRVSSEYHGMILSKWYKAINSEWQEIAFQINGDYPLSKSWYININIGWKAHKGFNRLMFAGRIVPRKY